MLRISGSFYDGAASWTLIEMTMYYEYFTLYAVGVKRNISSIPAHRVQRKWIYRVSIRLEPPCLHKGSSWWHYFVYQLNRLLAHWDK